MFVEHFHERVWIELLHVPNAWLLPCTIEHKRRPNHGGHTCSVRYRLCTYFIIALRMIAVVINEDGFRGNTTWIGDKIFACSKEKFGVFRDYFRIQLNKITSFTGIQTAFTLYISFPLQSLGSASARHAISKTSAESSAKYAA